eukprot:10722376-Alexandrium_andersonii.AAC.1
MESLAKTHGRTELNQPRGRRLGLFRAKPHRRRILRARAALLLAASVHSGEGGCLSLIHI